jgi:hypothetical protein
VVTLSLTTFGTLTGSDPVTVTGSLSWKGGVMRGPGATTIAAGGTVAFGGAFSANLDGRNFENDGTATWAGSINIDLSNGSVFTNTGTLTDQDNHGLSGNGGTFNNLGTYIKSVNAGETDVGSNVLFTNRGSVLLQMGKLSFGAGYTQTDGLTLVSAGSTLVASQGVNILGGVLAGSGIINADVTNAGQVSPGGDGAAGVLTINGKYTQTATGVLNMEIGGDAPGSGYDQLVISGSATLDGMLNVNVLNGFVAPSGETFPILTFASLNGTFATTNLDPAFMSSPLYDPMDVTILTN